MNHNEFKQMIQLSLYGELPQEKQKLLLLHIESCVECRTELEQQKNFMSLITGNKYLEVNEELLKEARIQLRGGLRIERSKSIWFPKFSVNIIKLFSSPSKLALGTISVLIIGIVLGSILFGREKQNIIKSNTDFTDISLTENQMRVANLRFTDSDMSDGEVEFTFDAVKPVRLIGSVNDPKIQSILTYAMLNDQNPGSRLNSINAMDSYGNISIDKDIKDALVTVVMTDNNPGVRREAINLLDRVGYDESVKQAYLYVLLNDSSSALRIEALNALMDAAKQGHKLNQNDVDLVIQKANLDNNNYIKLKSKTLIEEYN
jgi:hypothetical protein